MNKQFLASLDFMQVSYLVPFSPAQPLLSLFQPLPFLFSRAANPHIFAGPAPPLTYCRPSPSPPLNYCRSSDSAPPLRFTADPAPPFNYCADPQTQPPSSLQTQPHPFMPFIHPLISFSHLGSESAGLHGPITAPPSLYGGESQWRDPPGM